MELLEERIRRDGRVLPGDILKVDSFLNHRMDVGLFREMAKEWKRLAAGLPINKILTIEASGIAIATVVAMEFGDIPLVFAKKSRTKNLSAEVWQAEVKSYTHGGTSNIFVSKQYLTPEDHVLIIDDFMAMGEAAEGLISITEQSGATVYGIGIAIEKGFQPGGKNIRKRGYNLWSLAVICMMDSEKGEIIFRNCMNS